MTYLMSDGVDCRTAPATPGLLKNFHIVLNLGEVRKILVLTKNSVEMFNIQRKSIKKIEVCMFSQTIPIARKTKISISPLHHSSVLFICPTS